MDNRDKQCGEMATMVWQAVQVSNPASRATLKVKLPKKKGKANA